jgi:hypothetical protein
MDVQYSRTDGKRKPSFWTLRQLPLHRAAADEVHRQPLGRGVLLRDPGRASSASCFCVSAL